MAEKKKKKKFDLDAAIRRTEALKGKLKKWNVEQPEEESPPQVKKPKPKKESWLFRAARRLLKRKPRTEEGITRPANVRTPEQIAEWRELMGIKGKKKK